MSIRAGSILTVAGQNVVDRVQRAGLGDTRIDTETIREVGNREVVGKVPGEPNFTWTMESLNVSVEVMAWLTGDSGSQASGSAPGANDPDGTEYDWNDVGFVNVASPWKDPDSGASGTIEAGHLIPGYFPTRIRYRFGVTDNSTQEVELSGGAFYYGGYAAIEQVETGDGNTKAFATDDATEKYREGGKGGTSFRNVFGVIVDGQLMTNGIDYTVSGGDGSTATVTFEEAPGSGADIRFCYFTDAAKTYPQTVHASTQVLPAAVRGRNIRVEIEDTRVGGIQSVELEATVEGDISRELGSTDPVGRDVTGTDCTGTITARPKDKDAFLDLLEDVTGVDRDEVFGWFNINTVDLKIKIEDPKNPGNYIKTLWIEDAQFSPPGTPAQVNAATDFALTFESANGTFKEVKGVPA